MSVFKNPEALEEVIGGFLQELATEPSISKKMLATKTTYKINYSDPEVAIIIDCTGDEVVVRIGDVNEKAAIEMSMKADLGHKFWHGKLNVPLAFATRKIKTKGSIPEVLKLLPIMKPAFVKYPKYLESHNYKEYKL